MKTIKQYKKHTSILLVTILISITGYTAYFINKNININQSFIVDKKGFVFFLNCRQISKTIKSYR